ncbi:trypsin-like peptidase domain-containing protein [Roseivirga thermotolerans]|mgnify:CR=1 FL=1|jgi:Do/DeqQ family serine protease|uniref:Serine protease n=1 Tax=Roseivirga thermotolerans TaxID=1758176 RepID=A0ABQ3I5F4_9BACT|nr:trypsin-like peptidase domain-containing protein [Roseivirga thermotolerans]MEC7755122.1 trypsin-like peptidase domain-containing protein [Bacteroidota bacterium]GHE56071.1 serine protease [Roseivirga thermotolerans]|tara:strand:- start:16262 stop:17710 length:1449 start_codon:yes stop_codon:yes gene_type:complete
MISKRQFFLGILASSLLGGLIVLLGLSLFNGSDGSSETSISGSAAVSTSLGEINPVRKDYVVPEGINFIKASRKAVPAVVHITNTSISSRNSSSWSRLFGRERRARQSTGSGVLISADGYIATNYHVVEDADELEVRLDDNRRIDAELIGVDPDTDLALIKIDAKNLPHVEFGNSDQVEIGEWVLAVGNPFDLNNTVTAGIVSAKARNINLIQSGQVNNYGIESFIQTDAVVNRGNSGGALVNLDGELIGINTAIATNTGTFNGYSFAVPSILVKKVMDDLLEFGKVQRGLLGVQITDADGRFTNELSGVLISGVSPGGAAERAGIKIDDVIVGIDDRTVRTTSELQELVARKRPGDEILVKYKRDGKLKETKLKLRKKDEFIAGVPEEVTLSYKIEGSTFIDINENIKTRLKIEGGVQLVEMGEGAWKEAGIKEGFVITKVGDVDIKGLSDFQELLDAKTRDFYVMGKYPNGYKDYYRINW